VFDDVADRDDADQLISLDYRKVSELACGHDLGVARNPSLKSERSCGSRWGGAGQPRLVVYDST
jgi:hypothetical protein